MSFVADGKGSRFIDMSEDRWPQLEVTFKGKNAGKEPELIDVDEFIGKKGFRAKGKKVSSLEVKNVVFVEPLVKEETVEPADEDVTEEPEVEEPDSYTPEEDLTDWSNPSEPTLF